MSLRQLWQVLRARSLLIFGCFVLAALVGVALAFLLPRQYEASVAIVIDGRSAGSLGEMLPPQMLSGYLATQVDVITSRRVTELAAARPEISQDPVLREQWREATEERIDFKSWLGNVLKSQLKVEPSRASQMVEISYACPEPERCARIVNAVAQAYVATNLEMRVSPAREHAQWFDERTQTLRANLEAAQRRLSEYQREHGIIATDERLDVETARLEELSRQLVAVQGEHSGSRSWRGNSGTPDTLPDVVRNPLITGLKGELARLEATYSQSASRLGPNHPELVKIRREVESVRARIASETRNIVGSLDTTARVDAAREASIREAIEEQRAHVLQLKSQRDAIAVLQKDVDNAQRVYEQVTGRLAETNLESQAQQTNVFMLAPASATGLPSSPRRALMIALSMVLGLALGIGLALALELARRPVRSEADLVEALGIPVIGVLPRALIAPQTRR